MVSGKTQNIHTLKKVGTFNSFTYMHDIDQDHMRTRRGGGGGWGSAPLKIFK